MDQPTRRRSTSRSRRHPERRKPPRSLSPSHSSSDSHSRRDTAYRGRGDRRHEDRHHARPKDTQDRSPRHRREREERDRRPSPHADRPRRRRSPSPDAARAEWRRRPRDDDADDRSPRDRHSQSQRTRRKQAASRSRSRSPPPPARRSRDERERRDQVSAGRQRPAASASHPPDEAPAAPGPDKEQPNFGRSGKLAAETNTVAGTKIVLKYHEPPEARLPLPRHEWRMYEFKGEETLSTTALGSRSCWLIGRETAVCDIAVLHPSCSGQHAVLQFRHVEKRNEFGDRVGRVRLYVLDLESANGTTLNGERIEDRRFIEVRANDVLRFGESTREYVVLLA